MSSMICTSVSVCKIGGVLTSQGHACLSIQLWSYTQQNADLYQKTYILTTFPEPEVGS